MTNVHENRLKTQIWTTATGEKIPIEQMKDWHLVNTIRMLEKTAKNTHNMELTMFLSVQGPDGDTDAAMAYDQEYNALASRSYMEYIHPSYSALVKEAIERHLIDHHSGKITIV